MEAAVWDSSYAVSGAALNALNKIDKDSAYAYARRILPTNPRSALSDAVWQIIGKHGKREDFESLERYSAGLYGKERQRMMERMLYFASETTDDSLYAQSLVRVVREARAEQDLSSRGSIGSQLIRVRRYYDIEAQKKGHDAEIATRRAVLAKEQETILIDAEQDEAVKRRLEQTARGGAE
jgi:hypothetical protein